MVGAGPGPRDGRARPVVALPARARELRAQRGSRFAISRRDGAFGPVSFALRAGEIVGLYGIVGAGRSELAEALFGLAPADGGEILVDGRKTTIRSAGSALKAGVALVPEDRHRMGLATMLSISTNMSLSALASLTTLGFVNRAAEKDRGPRPR